LKISAIGFIYSTRQRGAKIVRSIKPMQVEIIHVSYALLPEFFSREIVYPSRY
jgi:hypothetical protein